MVNIIGVRFRNISKVYYFDPKDLVVRSGDHVIVETSRGLEYGRVIFEPRLVPEDKIVRPLREVCRIADEKDDQKIEENRKKEKEAYQICVRKINEHHLDMKLIDVEFAFDDSKILFYFTADGRIDFRILVKDLAAIFKTRIELRQIGVRDEAKILGGIGICGRSLCCHSYLTDFVPVSIRMAKEQNLSLNQTKISGVCGRLMCCLKNEQETYEELNRKLPSPGDMVILEEGLEGKVHSVNVLRQTVKVMIELDDEKEMVECSVDEITFHQKKKKGKDQEKGSRAEKNTKDSLVSLDDEEIPDEYPEKRGGKNQSKKNTGSVRGESGNNAENSFEDTDLQPAVPRKDKKAKKNPDSSERREKNESRKETKEMKPGQGKTKGKPKEDSARKGTRKKPRNSAEKKESPEYGAKIPDKGE